MKGRVDLNPTNYSLTVRGLTPQDSGVFSFASEVQEKHRPTVFITLQVHGKMPLVIFYTLYTKMYSTYFLLNFRYYLEFVCLFKYYLLFNCTLEEQMCIVST